MLDSCLSGIKGDPTLPRHWLRNLRHTCSTTSVVRGVVWLTACFIHVPQHKPGPRHQRAIHRRNSTWRQRSYGQARPCYVAWLYFKIGNTLQRTLQRSPHWTVSHWVGQREGWVMPVFWGQPRVQLFWHRSRGDLCFPTRGRWRCQLQLQDSNQIQDLMAAPPEERRQPPENAFQRDLELAKWLPSYRADY